MSAAPMAPAALLVASILLAQPAPASTSTVTETATASVADAPPRIDLITIGVGSEMYAIFGHGAIRVVDPDGSDTAYNFGGVDLEQPNFWSRVVRGRLEAYLEVTSYSDLLLKYSAEDRTIVGRTLRFTPEQARRLVARLEQIRHSEARTYRYHHIYDNCTTKIAEVFDEVLGGELRAQAERSVPGTHREWILDRIRNLSGLYLTMDLVGNGMGDVPITAWDRVYIPVGFDDVVDKARFGGKPFVARRYLDYRSMSFDKPVVWDWPWNKVYMLFSLPLLLLMLWRARPPAFVWGLFAGLLGLGYIFFWVATDYPFYHRNWNMLVFPPTHLALAFAALSANRWRSKWLQVYLLAHAAVLAGLVLGRAFGMIQQAIDPMLGVAVPLAFALGWAQWRARSQSKARPSSALAPG